MQEANQKLFKKGNLIFLEIQSFKERKTLLPKSMKLKIKNDKIKWTANNFFIQYSFTIIYHQKSNKNFSVS